MMNHVQAQADGDGKPDFVVRHCKDFGRYLIASGDIPERKLILDEYSLVHAPADECEPHDESSAMLFCLGCCHHVNIKDVNGSDLDVDVDGSGNDSDNCNWNKCALCGWPLCKSCRQQEDHLHKENECRVFQLNRVKFPPPHGWPVLYKSILVLRIILLVKEKNPCIWKQFFEQLETHNDVRRGKEHCIKSDKMIFENIKHFLLLKGEGEERCKSKNALSLWDKELTQEIIGIINVNAFGASKGNLDCGNLRKSKNLFEKASIFAHSCSPNCTWKIEMDYKGKGIKAYWKPRIKVYTSIPIAKGDLLTIPYNTRHLFYGTLKRQILIENVAHFLCKCSRCEDPTEKGTFMSSLRCFQCDEGFLVPQNQRQNQNCQERDWICTRQMCQASESVSKIVYFVTEVEDFLDKIQSADLPLNKEIELLDKLFRKHHGILLHENHYTLQEISTRILELLVEKLGQCDEKLVDLFIWHCDYLKKIADVILPGYNGYQDQLLDYKTEGLFHKKNPIANI